LQISGVSQIDLRVIEGPAERIEVCRASSP
jgi:hypothetical protein